MRFETKTLDITALDEFIQRVGNAGLLQRVLANDGGMKILGAYSLVKILTELSPRIYIELGAWKGLSVEIVESFFAPHVKCFAFDPSLHHIQNKLCGVNYSSKDWATPYYQQIQATDGPTLLFADDHQDVVERLLVAWSRGVEYVLFDDDYNQSADHRTVSNFIVKLSEGDAVYTVLDRIVSDIQLIRSPSGIQKLEQDKIETHWRDQALVRLTRMDHRGWTMGQAHFESFGAR
jgi:hypothetical protein